MSQRTSWWCKSRRAQSKDDFETWLEGGVVPTLNAFDNGDTRAVVLVADGLDEEQNGARELMGTLKARKEGGGFEGTVAIVQEPIVFYGNRVDDIRVQGEVVNTLQARMGTGGGNMPLVAYPIDDAREIEKHQNGTEIGNANDPAYTLDTRQHPAVVMPTLSASNNPSRSPQSAEVTAQVAAMVEATSIVRRLTPTECERLMGFPDSWTKFDADGKEQADSHRYKQCGNAVAVPVVDFIISRLVALHDG